MIYLCPVDIGCPKIMDSNIRNFCIIAHIDSGKSTLADRFLELTGTVEKRKMQPQYLDKLELERERGITIKLAPVRMRYRLYYDHDDNNDNNPKSHRHQSLSGPEYILNLIDTPGHSDFSYEVSRALAAVEGAILLVDGTKGIQAQTLSNLHTAEKAGLKIIGAVNKIDLELPQLEKTIESLANLLGKNKEEIFRVSAKTGFGVKELLDAVVSELQPPQSRGDDPRALIFDSLYDGHKGIVAFVRTFSGAFRAGDNIRLFANGKTFKVKEVGHFVPEFKSISVLGMNEIGYIATGLKEPAVIRIGDTVGGGADVEPLPGYKEPSPVVFIAFYPDGKTEFDDLKKGLEKLRLNDAALSFEPDANEALGRGLKVGFLGQLHFEITVSRLASEFGLKFLTSFPSISYRVEERGKSRTINEPHNFPDKPDRVWQPMIKLEILTPQKYLGSITNLKNVFDLEILSVETLGDNLIVMARMPLAELIRDFDDRLKSVSAGFASFSYEMDGEELAAVEKLEILVVNDVVHALTRIVAKRDLEREARRTVERLKKLLPRQQFSQAVQAKAQGRIIARETVPAMRKDVTGHLYGGDRSRKMKLWKKQQRGKEKLKGMARVELSPEVFREILKK